MEVRAEGVLCFETFKGVGLTQLSEASICQGLEAFGEVSAGQDLYSTDPNPRNMPLVHASKSGYMV